MSLNCFCPWPYIPNALTKFSDSADIFSNAVHAFHTLFWKICPLFWQLLITCLKCSRCLFCLPLKAKWCAGDEVAQNFDLLSLKSLDPCHTIRASDRFLQPIFLRILSCIGAFIRCNECNICWLAVTCMGDSQPPAWSNFPNLTSFYPISCMAKFCAEQSSKQNESKISRPDQKSNTEIGVRPLYLSPILQWFYSIGYGVRFWCGNTLLEGDFKNTKTYKNIRGKQVIRPFLLYLEEFNQIDSLFAPYEIWSVSSSVISY